MKVTIRRTKGVITSVSFRAGKGVEGVHLKEAVLVAAKDGLTPMRVIEELQLKGYLIADDEKGDGRMTTEEHRARHVELHKAFDELLADYLTHHPGSLPSNTTIEGLAQWSCEQMTEPTEHKGSGA
jgi:hypothetical protein